MIIKIATILIWTLISSQINALPNKMKQVI